MNLSDAYESVRDFHKSFGHPHADKPQLLAEGRVDVRASWLREEVDEFCEAETAFDQADAMIDLIYFALGSLVEMGVDPRPLFEIVHGANMKKLWPDGKPHYDPDGKVIKPQGWQNPGPQLREELRRQGWEG